MNKTPLYETHVALGAKMVPFSGWEMPLSYTGVLEEHHSVRSGVGLFDISHMGRFDLYPQGAKTTLMNLLPTPIQKLKRGEAQYSMLLNDEGGIIDDIYVYRKGTDRFFIIVNAANRSKDFAWIQSHLSGSAKLHDRTDETALLALQGPRSWEVLVQVIPFGNEEIALRTFIETEFILARGATAIIARTGYTGERGYEIVIPAEMAVKVWNILMEAGRGLNIKPVGLGARDTLRLEKGYPLYGHEMDETTTPVEAGLTSFLYMRKEFIGKKNIIEKISSGVERKLIGFELVSGGIPREGCRIYSGHKEIGVVTSGNFSPSLKRGIGMGYVEARYADIGSEIFIILREREVAAGIVKRPFYRKTA